jgi:adenylate cyclase
VLDGSYRVLVVDDQPQNLLLAEVHLKALGCTVEKATDGFAALAAVERQPPDLILLDVMMPGMDGFAVCRKLKADREWRHIPIVLVTALNSSEDRVAGIEAGADDFITKPFNRHELTARVKSLLRVKRLEERERLHMRRTLERYLDSAVARQLLDAPELALPGGRRQDASILFADIRGFTAWSEQQDAESVVEVVNLFLAQAIEVVFRHGGTVDKFTGDGLMALFGAPIPSDDHPRRAVAAALDIVASAATIAHPRLTQPLAVGCGINSGEVIVGNVGSERRLDYTAMGDVVNVASRLTDLAAGGQVLISQATRDRVGDLAVADLGDQLLHNRRDPVRVYNALGWP